MLHTFCTFYPYAFFYFSRQHADREQSFSLVEMRCFGVIWVDFWYLHSFGYRHANAARDYLLCIWKRDLHVCAFMYFIAHTRHSRVEIDIQSVKMSFHFRKNLACDFNDLKSAVVNIFFKLGKKCRWKYFTQLRKHFARVFQLSKMFCCKMFCQMRKKTAAENIFLSGGNIVHLKKRFLLSGRKCSWKNIPQLIRIQIEKLFLTWGKLLLVIVMIKSVLLKNFPQLKKNIAAERTFHHLRRKMQFKRLFSVIRK